MSIYEQAADILKKDISQLMAKPTADLAAYYGYTKHAVWAAEQICVDTYNNHLSSHLPLMAATLIEAMKGTQSLTSAAALWPKANEARTLAQFAGTSWADVLNQFSHMVAMQVDKALNRANYQIDKPELWRERTFEELRTYVLDGWSLRDMRRDVKAAIIGLDGEWMRQKAAAAPEIVPPKMSREAPQDSVTSRSPVLPFKIDESALKVTMDGRTLKFSVRNTRLLKLLARISKRPGHQVQFDTLRQTGDVWDGQTVEDSTIKGALSRLRRELRKAKMGVLAGAIKTSIYDHRAFVYLDSDAFSTKSK